MTICYLKIKKIVEMTNDYLNSSFLAKESKNSDQINDYSRNMKVIKHSIKVRPKADTKWQLKIWGVKHAEREGKK